VKLRFFTAILLLLGAASRAQTDDAPPALHGKIEGHTYISASGTFRMAIPVLLELGGSVLDTENVVTFGDDFKTHVSVAVFAQDATQRWENETRGRRDYLIYFFSNYLMPDFQQHTPGALIVPAPVEHQLGHVPVGDHDALGRARGARGVHQVGRLIGPAAAGQGGPGPRPGTGDHDPDAAGRRRDDELVLARDLVGHVHRRGGGI